MRDDLLPGTVLAGYVVESLVGRGGMGVVYRARDLRLDRSVALKVLSPQLAADSSFRERFERESRLAAAIDHPNIVPVYQAGEADGRLFIAMRWVDGSDLGEVLERDHPLAVERVVALLEQIAAALDAAHEYGLIHRDVKPANVLVTGRPGAGRREHAYLTDFGISKTSSSTRLTRTGFFLGTPDYAAPEQFEGKELDPRVDVYALGCLLFHCLSSRRPFERTDDLAVMYAHVQEPPPRISDVRQDVPTSFDDVIATAMAKSRDERYATCGDLVRAAHAALQGSALPHVVTPWPGEEAVAAPPPAGTPASTLAAGGETVAAGDETVAAASPSETREAEAPTAAGGAVDGSGVSAETVEIPGAAEPQPAAAPGEARGHGKRRLVIAAGVLAVGIAGAVFALGGTGSTPTPTGPWTRVESAALEGADQQVVNRLAAREDGTVLAAGATGKPGERNAVVWFVSGLPGQPKVESTPIHQPGDQTASGIVSPDQASVLVVGFDRPTTSEFGDAAVWKSSGLGFHPIALASPTYETMNRVTLTETTIVAVGASGPGRMSSGVPRATDAAVWRSKDGGSTWERVSAGTFAKPGYQEIRGVTDFGHGLVAVGSDRKAGAVWLSDGAEWRRVAADSPALAVTGGHPSSNLIDVQPLRGDLVAVGIARTANGDTDAAVWTSPDGETWTFVTTEGFSGPGDQRLLGVTTGDFGAVAVGCTNCDTPQEAPMIWASKDGRSWSRVAPSDLPPVEGPEKLTSVTVAGNVLVAGGARNGDATVWVGPAVR